MCEHIKVNIFQIVLLVAEGIFIFITKIELCQIEISIPTAKEPNLLNKFNWAYNYLNYTHLLGISNATSTV